MATNLAGTVLSRSSRMVFRQVQPLTADAFRVWIYSIQYSLHTLLILETLDRKKEDDPTRGLSLIDIMMVTTGASLCIRPYTKL